ncbi:hypothetical protein TNCV_1937801 [Trichonephila clavipes]|nr:hypothetical protein TNCV_1937801 [Trichonephila clavipes]
MSEWSVKTVSVTFPSSLILTQKRKISDVQLPIQDEKPREHRQGLEKEVTIPPIVRTPISDCSTAQPTAPLVETHPVIYMTPIV